MSAGVWVGRQGGEVVPEVANRVRELVEAGKSDEEIGAAIGQSARTAKRVRHALRLLAAATPSTVVADGTLRELHAEGLDNRAIAARAGLTVRTVQERLLRLGLASHRPRPPATPRRRRRGEGSDRDAQLHIRVSKEELAAYEARARSAGFDSVSEWVRHRLEDETSDPASSGVE